MKIKIAREYFSWVCTRFQCSTQKGQQQPAPNSTSAATVFKIWAGYCNGHWEQRHYEESAATWNFSHKVWNQTDLMLRLEQNPVQIYYQSFSVYRSVKPYACFFIHSSARAVIQPVITMDSDFPRVHMRPLNEQILLCLALQCGVY